MFDLSGKVALVTGANSGLGFAFSRGLAKAGAKLVIWGRRAEKNEQAAERLRAFGGAVLADSVDVCDDAAIARGVERALAEFGRIDIAVANAGIARQAPFVDMTRAAYRELIDVNLDGAVFTLRAVARHMVDRALAGDPGGSLIICGSGAIAQGVPTLAHYGIAKGGLNSLARAPGFIQTEMTFADPDIGAMMAEQFAARVPLGRIGQPDDLEGAVVYLASDAGRYHTGDTLVIDGGKSFAN